MSSADKIAKTCDDIKAMLLAKNEAYGDSALDPVECFAKGLTPLDRMGVRLDDKISRLMRGGEFPGDDTLLDIAGYIILMLIAREDARPKDGPIVAWCGEENTHESHLFFGRDGDAFLCRHAAP